MPTHERGESLACPLTWNDDVPEAQQREGLGGVACREEQLREGRGGGREEGGRTAGNNRTQGEGRQDDDDRSV